MIFFNESIELLSSLLTHPKIEKRLISLRIKLMMFKRSKVNWIISCGMHYNTKLWLLK